MLTPSYEPLVRENTLAIIMQMQEIATLEFSQITLHVCLWPFFFDALFWVPTWNPVSIVSLCVLLAAHISVYFSDLNTVYRQPEVPFFPSLNRVYYRSSLIPSSDDAARMARDVAEQFPQDAPFAPSFLAVVTWFGVAAYGSSSPSSQLNTFQVQSYILVLIIAFVVFCIPVFLLFFFRQLLHRIRVIGHL